MGSWSGPHPLSLGHGQAWLEPSLVHPQDWLPVAPAPGLLILKLSSLSLATNQVLAFLFCFIAAVVLPPALSSHLPSNDSGLSTPLAASSLNNSNKTSQKTDHYLLPLGLSHLLLS